MRARCVIISILIPNTFVVNVCVIPDGLVVRIPGFHPGGPGSIPGLGNLTFFGDMNLFLGNTKFPLEGILKPFYANSSILIYLQSSISISHLIDKEPIKT